MAKPNELKNAATGLAALSICEALILALEDLKIMGEKDAIDVMTNATTAHRNAGSTAEEIAMHHEVVAILERIVAGGNSIRRP